MVCIRVGVIYQVLSVTWGRLPREHLEESATLDMYNAFIPTDPADGIVQKAKQIAVPGEPKGAFDVCGKVRETAVARFAEHDRWLIGMRNWRGCQFPRVLHENPNDPQHRVLHWSPKQPGLPPREPGGVRKTRHNRRAAVDAGAARTATGD